MTGRELLQAAHVEAKLIIPSESLTAADANWSMGKFNRMLGLWSNDGRMVYAQQIARYTLGTAQETYTIGRGTPAADFVADRPVGSGIGKGIQHANIVVSDVRYPVRLLNAEEWSGLNMPDLSAAIPWALYNDGAAPNSTLYLYGWPNEANELELYTNQQLTEITLDGDVTFPQGYDEALILSHAEGICGSFGMAVTPELRIAAQKARSVIASTNSTPPRISTTDSGIPNQARGFNSAYLFGRL